MSGSDVWHSADSETAVTCTSSETKAKVHEIIIG